jgi:hypothetical protein
MAFGIAFYVTPNWTLPRVFGSLLEYLWRRKHPATHAKYTRSPFFSMLSEDLDSFFALLCVCTDPD